MQEGTRFIPDDTRAEVDPILEKGSMTRHTLADVLTRVSFSVVIWIAQNWLPSGPTSFLESSWGSYVSANLPIPF